MKATEIYNKAKNEVIAFASYQMSNIKDWLVRTGVWEDTDEKTWGFSPYWLSLADFKKNLSILVPAKEVVAIRFTINKEVIVVFDESGEDELYLATLELSEQVKVCNLLEELWTELIHQKTN